MTAPPLDHPLVSVVVATHRRPELLAIAIESILAQRYPGPIEVVLVFDQAEPDRALARDDGQRAVRVLENVRSPGLAGARNTGIAAARGEFVAFCDDDDAWLPEKLGEQIDAFARAPESVAAVCGIIIDFEGRPSVRVPRAADLTRETLLRGRVAAAHPSSYIVRRALVEEVGPVDEDLPGSYGEDYDWLLRWVERGPVAVVELPLVRVRWGATSYFADRWQMMADAIEFLVDKHPDFRKSRSGFAYMWGRRAFALAAAGRPADARRCAREALACNRLELRAYLAYAVTLHLLSPAALLRFANARGRGV